MSDSSEYAETSGDEETSRYPQRRRWRRIPYDEEITPDYRTPGVDPEDFIMPGSSPYQQHEVGRVESDESESDEGESEEVEFEQSEHGPPFARHGTPEHLPTSQPYSPESGVSEPVLPLALPVMSENTPQASSYGMDQMLYPSRDNPNDYLPDEPERGLFYGTPLPIRLASSSSSRGSAEGSSPQLEPNVSPHPLSSAGGIASQGSASPPGSESHYGPPSIGGSMAVELSPSIGGSMAVEVSPSVQDLSPAQYAYQGEEYSGTGQQKRGRESSNSSSAGSMRPQRKHHRGVQIPNVPQSIPEAQQGLTSFLEVGGFGPGGSHAQPPQGRGIPYAYVASDPYRREEASESQQIAQAYASQEVYQPRPNLFAGMQRSAPSSYTAGAGRGYVDARPAQGESSAQGAGHLQPPRLAQPAGPYAHLPHGAGAGRGADQFQSQPVQPTQPVGPGAAPSNTGGTRGEYASRPQPQLPQRQGESGGPAADQPLRHQSLEAGGTAGPGSGVPDDLGESMPEPWNPMRGMSASGIWKFINGHEFGGEDSEGGDNWEGPTFKVDGTATYYWTPDHLDQLQVIVASFTDWPEVVSLGQRLPGQHSAVGCLKKLIGRDTDNKIWTMLDDVSIRKLSSPRLEDRQVALKYLMEECGRSKDAIIGRCMLFARSNQGVNLGNAPGVGFTLLQKQGHH